MYRERFQGDGCASAMQRVESMVDALKLLRDASSHLPASTVQKLNDIINRSSSLAADTHSARKFHRTPASVENEVAHHRHDLASSNHGPTGAFCCTTSAASIGAVGTSRQPFVVARPPTCRTAQTPKPRTAWLETCCHEMIPEEPGYPHVLRSRVSPDQTDEADEPHPLSFSDENSVFGALAVPTSAGALQCAQLTGCRSTNACAPSTLVIDKVASWKRRKEATSHLRSGFEPCFADRRVVFMLVQQKGTGGASTRFCTLGQPPVDIRMGQQLENSHHGFPVAETPEDTLRLTPRRRVSESCLAVIKGIANGMGCARGRLLYMPFFRPVYPVDLTVTHCS
jgi:hypothetical protein